MNWFMLSVASCATAMATTSVSAQLVMPPKEAPAPTPAYVPPPPRPERPAPRPTTQRPQIDQFQYQSLVSRNEDGSLKPLETYIELASLERNPLVMEMDAEKQDAIKRATAKWKEMVDRLVIDNLDLIHQLDTGLIDQLTIEDRDSVGQLTAIVKPLTLLEDKRRLVDYLFQEGLINGQVVALNEKIGQEYRQALRDDYTNTAVKTAAEDEHISIIARSFFHDMVRDTMDSYHAQLLHFASVRAAVLGAAESEMSASERQAMSSHKRALSAASTDAAKIKAAKALLKSLPLESQRAILTAARAQ